jgi:hypothetical protein
MMVVRQNFPQAPPLDIPATLRREFEKIQVRGRIAVTAGSRGITHIREITAAVVAILKEKGARPFVIPAMGSHAGATPEGQRDFLAGYGITEESVGCPIVSSLETRVLGTTDEGIPAHCSVDALGADGIVVVNRIKPHTDFSGKVGSGLMKMIAIGLGKQRGAAATHAAGSRLGLEKAIRAVSRITLRQAPILCGVGIIENQFHETARLAVLGRDEIETREEALLEEARRLMPRIPFDEIDFLILDRIGKNITGAGMDPNIVNRDVHGYSSRLSHEPPRPPVIRRIFVRDLTPESHGNAIGLGLADFTTTRLVRGMDVKSSYMNALTALSVQSVKIPIHFDTDREALEHGLRSCALADVRQARVVRIQDTLSLATLEASEAYAGVVKGRPDLSVVTPAREMAFDADGNLPPLGAS